MKHHTPKYTYLERDADDAPTLNSATPPAIRPASRRSLRTRVAKFEPIYYSRDGRIELFSTPSQLSGDARAGANTAAEVDAAAGQVYTPVAGVWFHSVAEVACDIAATTGLPFRFRFNGIVLEVGPDADPTAVGERFERACEARRAAYWTSARLAEQASQEAKDREALRAHYEARHGVNDLGALLDWFVRLEELSSTHASLTKDERAEIVAWCATVFGVTPGMNCVPEEFKPTRAAGAEWFARQSREFKLRWLLGQALSGTINIGYPHSIIHKFAAEYRP